MLLSPLFLAGLSAFLLAGSARRYQRGHEQQAVLLLMAAALCLRVGAAGVDPFLHSWDERYHALVAKNLLTDWARPVLRAQPVLAYDFRQWCCNHVWLHKQPLFLWQLAGSLQLFGVSEWALRLPSAVLGALVIWPIYRIGRLVFGADVGYRAGLLFALAYYPLELTSGWQSVDHADIAFLFYVTASLWAYYESREPGAHSTAWMIVIGLLAGAAVLCKWLPGLVVFAAWGVDVLASPTRRRHPREYGRLLAAAAVAVAVFLPWQLYIRRHFPLESAYEQQYAARHFGEVLEDKGGPGYFYLTNLWYQFQWLVLPLAAGLALLLTRRLRTRPVLPLLVSCGTVFGFFTLAATKMVSYTYVVAPLLLVLVALAWAEASRWLRRQNPFWRIAGPSILALAILLMDSRPTALLKHHTLRFATPALRADRQAKLRHTAVYRQLDALVPPGYLVLNAPADEDVEAMFYSHHNVYVGCPTETEFQDLRRRGIQVAAFAGAGSPALPGYLRQSEVLLLTMPLR